MRIRTASYRGPDELYFEAIRTKPNEIATEVVAWGNLTQAELFELHAALGDFLFAEGLQAAASSMSSR